MSQGVSEHANKNNRIAVAMRFSLTFLFLLFLCWSGIGSAATPLINDGVVSGSIEIEGESDEFTFYAVAGESIHVRVVGIGTRVELYNPDGTYNGNGSGLASVQSLSCYSSSYDCRLEQTGTYRIVVRAGGYPSTGSYEVYYARVLYSNENGGLTNDHIYNGHLSKGDIDTFVFEAKAGDAVQISVIGGLIATRPLVWLHNPDGTLNQKQLGLSTTTTLNCDPSPYGCQLNQTGTYRVVVEYYASTSSGNYEISFVGPPQHTSGITSLAVGTIPNTSVNTSVPIQIEAVNAAGDRDTSISGTVVLFTSPDVQISKTQLDMNAGLATGDVTFMGGSNPMILSARIGDLSADSNTFTVNNPSAMPSSLTIGALFNDVPLVAGQTATVHLTDHNGVEVTAIANGSVDSKARFTGLTSGIYEVWAQLDQDVNIHSSRTRKIYVPDSKDVGSWVEVIDIRLNPVLIVPGMLGSTTGSTWGWFPKLPPTLADPDNLSIFTGFNDYSGGSPFTRGLLQAGFTLKLVPWDWRMTLDESTGVLTAFEKYLMAKIDEAKDPNDDGIPDFDKVDVVAHSMGGLMTRAYIQSTKYRNDIGRFVMLGTPNEGSTKAYYMAHGGDPRTAGPIYEDTTEYLMEQVGKEMYGKRKHRGRTTRVLLNKTIRKFYATDLPTAWELLPTYEFIKPPGSSNPVALSKEQEPNKLLDRLNNDNNTLSRMINARNTSVSPDKVKTVIFISNDQDTDGVLKVDTPSASSGLYPAGALLAKEDPVAGDETVTEDSAKNVNNICFRNATSDDDRLACWTDVIVCKGGVHSKMFKNFADQVRNYLSGASYECP